MARSPERATDFLARTENCLAELFLCGGFLDGSVEIRAREGERQENGRHVSEIEPLCGKSAQVHGTRHRVTSRANQRMPRILVNPNFPISPLSSLFFFILYICFTFKNKLIFLLVHILLCS